MHVVMQGHADRLRSRPQSFPGYPEQIGTGHAALAAFCLRMKDCRRKDGRQTALINCVCVPTTIPTTGKLHAIPTSVPVAPAAAAGGTEVDPFH